MVGVAGIDGIKNKKGEDPGFLYIQINRGHTRVNHVSFLFSGQTTVDLLPMQTAQK
jgi:hypothetical protein